jgi:hypothetical protein
MVAGSAFHKPLFSKVFGVNESQIVAETLPRRLYLKTQREKSNIDLIAWLPTNHENSRFGVVVENACWREAFDTSLNMFKDESNLMSAIKFHPNSQAKNLDSLQFSNQLTIDNNEMLARARVLVSDYSSAILDAIYLDVPVVIYLPNFEQGYSFDLLIPELYEGMKPGPIVHNIRDLEIAIRKSILNDKWSQNRRQAAMWLGIGNVSSLDCEQSPIVDIVLNAVKP